MAHIPYRKMVRSKQILAEFEPVTLTDGYVLKFRVMTFVLANANGEEYERGPCLSIQLFNSNNHFLRAISVEVDDLPRLIAKLKEVTTWLVSPA